MSFKIPAEYKAMLFKIFISKFNPIKYLVIYVLNKVGNKSHAPPQNTDTQRVSPQKTPTPKENQPQTISPSSNTVKLTNKIVEYEGEIKKKYKTNSSISKQKY